jgi:hypothetical protein
LWFRIQIRRGVLDTKLFDKVCHWLAIGQWFPPPIKLTATNWNIVESGVKQHNPNPLKYSIKLCHEYIMCYFHVHSSIVFPMISHFHIFIPPLIEWGYIAITLSVRSHFRNRYLSFYWKKWFYIWYMALAWW